MDLNLQQKSELSNYLRQLVRDVFGTQNKTIAVRFPPDNRSVRVVFTHMPAAKASVRKEADMEPENVVAIEDFVRGDDRGGMGAHNPDTLREAIEAPLEETLRKLEGDGIKLSVDGRQQHPNHHFELTGRLDDFLSAARKKDKDRFDRAQANSRAR